MKPKRWLMVPGIVAAWLACKALTVLLVGGLVATGSGGWRVAHGDYLATGVLAIGVAVVILIAKAGLLTLVWRRIHRTGGHTNTLEVKPNEHLIQIARS